MFKHPENTMAVNPKTPDFSAFSEFSVGTTCTIEVRITQNNQSIIGSGY
jgi:hypothetical protein